MSIAIAVMIIVTGLRLGVRVFRRDLVVGWDDVFIIPGAVSLLPVTRGLVQHKICLHAIHLSFLQESMMLCSLIELRSDIY